jgi:RimJ/RimL family protein N-acetyltransferase
LYSFANAAAHTPEFLGGCGLSHIHPIYKICNLGYWIRTPQHGHGYAGRAAKLAARYAFEHVN